MKKFTFGLGIVLLVAGCSRNENTGKGNSEEAVQDSIKTADSIAQVEIAKAAEAAAEQIRLDSLRQDSINTEERMRLRIKMFYDNPEKALKSVGFKKVYDKCDDDGEVECCVIKYERILNGRKITYTIQLDTSTDCYLSFSDPQDQEKFMEDAKSNGYKKGEYGYYWKEKNNYYYPYIDIEGRKVHVNVVP